MHQLHLYILAPYISPMHKVTFSLNFFLALFSIPFDIKKAQSTMSFPPNLGFTNSLIIDTDYYLILQELPSILPTLNQIPSPFSRNKMTINGYSRIEKNSNTKRSKSVDFADLTYPYQYHNPRSTPNNLADSKFESGGITGLNIVPKITTVHDSIPEQWNEECPEEVSGIIPGQKCSISPEACDRTVMDQQDVGKRLFPIRRSASISEGYSRIHHKCGSSAEDDDDQYGSGLVTKKRCGKKKGKFFGAFRRLFGL